MVQALYQWRVTGQAAEEIGANFIRDEDLREEQLAYFSELIAAIPARIERIDGLIAGHLDRAVEQVDITEQAILRLAVYELEFERGVPMKVVLDEAVELAKLFCAENGYQYVNGVLDKVAREVRGEEVAAVVGEAGEGG